MQRFLAILILISGMTACSSASTPGPTATVRLRPYLTPSPSQTSTLLPVLTQAVLPTPTTWIYVVVAGDNLSAIAARFGITLAALTAANPGVQSNTLMIGTKLVIPIGNTSTVEPTPTPVAVSMQQARCWPQSNGGLWCFALVVNDYAEMLENISLQFTLFTPLGSQGNSQLAYASLDILPPGQSMPLAAYFPPPVPGDVRVRVEALTSFRLLPTDPRYLSATVQNTLVSVDWSGRTAQVSGQVSVSASSGAANPVWVLGVAYDQAGEVVGLRRWQAPSPLPAGQSLPFSFEISSVGPEIDRIDFVVEAKQDLTSPSPTAASN